MSAAPAPVSEFKVVPVTPANRAACVASLSAAFFRDPLISHLAPDDGSRRAWMGPLMDANLDLTLADGHTYALEGPGGEVAGVIGANPPGKYPIPASRGLRYLWNISTRPNPWTPSILGLLRKGYPYLGVWDRLHYKGPHWYVYLLGTHPDRRRRGVGKRLLEHIHAMADRDGLPSYLETQNATNLAFYASAGYRQTEVAMEGREGPPVWGLLREPAKTRRMISQPG